MTETQDSTSSPANARRTALRQRHLRPWLKPSTLILLVGLTVLIGALSAGAGSRSIASGLDGHLPGSEPQSGPQHEIWGDVDCSGSINPIDSLKLLRKDAGLSSLSVQGLCPGPGSSVVVNAVTRVWGDGDCSGALNPVDSLKTLRFDAGLGAPKVDPTCPDFGSLVTVGAAAGQTLLNEVLFVPGVGDDPFVELKATGSGADPSGLLLVNERDDQFVIPNVGAIDGVEVLLLEFGGSDFLDDESGFVELRDGDEVLDRVAWGSDRVDGVRLTPGDFLTEFEPGTSIGRVPGSTGPNPIEWVTYRPGLTTPGGPNADPGVPVARPPDGAIFESGDVRFNWFPLPGIDAYRVEIASEATFSNLHTQELVNTPPLDLSGLAQGEHHWRVEALREGVSSGFSAVHLLTIDGAGLERSPAGNDLTVVNEDVPFLPPLKDSRMLLLEKDAPSGSTYAWDSPYPGAEETNGRITSNSVLASVAMVNAGIGGIASQDRLGFEVFEGRVAGPERDLSYGDMLTDDQALAVMGFAFGGVEGLCSTEIDEIWAFVTAVIDMELPLVAAVDETAIALNGYRITIENGPGPDIVEQFFLIKDPFVGSYQMPLDLSDVSCAWRPPESAIGFFQEAELESDSDGDGIVDFDEVRRFHTDPMHTDSDRDGLDDKQDLAESIFAPEEGYAADFAFIGDELFPLGSPARDWDRDGAKKELDCDSDNDGTRDGDDDDSFGDVDFQPDDGVCDAVATLTWNADVDLDLFVLPGPFDSSDEAADHFADPGYADAADADCLLSELEQSRSASVDVPGPESQYVAVEFFGLCLRDPDGPEGDGPQSTTGTLTIQFSNGTVFQTTELFNVNDWRLYGPFDFATGPIEPPEP